MHDLNRIDKHQVLHVCLAMASGISMSVEGDVPNFHGYIISNSGEAKVDAIACRYSCLPHPSGREVKMEPQLPLDIVFGHDTSVPLQPVAATLQAILDHVGNVGGNGAEYLSRLPLPSSFLVR